MTQLIEGVTTWSSGRNWGWALHQRVSQICGHHLLNLLMHCRKLRFVLTELHASLFFFWMANCITLLCVLFCTHGIWRLTNLLTTQTYRLVVAFRSLLHKTGLWSMEPVTNFLSWRKSPILLFRFRINAPKKKSYFAFGFESMLSAPRKKGHLQQGDVSVSHTNSH